MSEEEEEGRRTSRRRGMARRREKDGHARTGRIFEAECTARRRVKGWGKQKGENKRIPTERERGGEEKEERGERERERGEAESGWKMARDRRRGRRRRGRCWKSCGEREKD